ncbi:hypothetical protein [Kitasatospora griseola]|uniref:hypothetical protein n=1 Tax=Kitasatospora griseola TaxID=2064 RepID=UPI001670EAA6|nr:hypothetical protein [Kitasatospora griseola]GGQ69698.1 hypothetical protein GCM10010195_26560 [Kitasatospora griseola]
MLNSAWRAALCALTGIGLTVAFVPSASADVTPCADDIICTGIHEPGSGGTPGGGSTGGGGDSGSDTCSWNGRPVPCWRDDLGWFSSGCYYRLAKPQPLETEDVWDGKTGKDGAIYDRACLGNEAPGSVFLAQPPGGMKPPTPRQLAFDALDQIKVARPVLHAAPQTDAVVGSPVWFWFDATPQSAGPISHAVPGPGYTVTTTVTLKQVVWSVDDGPAGGRSQEFTCSDPGTPFAVGQTPSCSHIFARSSAAMADHAYTVRVALLWRVTAKTSANTDIDMADFTWRSEFPGLTLRIPVNEVQVLN